MTKRPTWEAAAESTANTVRQSYRLVSLPELRAEMVSRNYLSGYALAKAAGLNPGVVNHLVHGRRSTASPRTVGALRGVFGDITDELFVLDKSQVHRNRAAA